MEKPRLNTMYEEAADALDSSYVELQEHDLLDSQSQEFSSALTQTNWSENSTNF